MRPRVWARALAQIAVLPDTPALRREQIKFQVALANALMHTKGYAASDTKESLNQARLLIERAEKIGEPPEDPSLVFSVLYGFWAANFVAFNGDAMRELAMQFLSIAEKQNATLLRMIGHRLMGTSLTCTGNVVEGRAHYDQAIALYDPAEHRSVATQFGQDVAVVILSLRSFTLWLLGYPEAARADVERGLKRARELDQAGTSMYALHNACLTYLCCGDYASATTQANDLTSVADKSNALYWRALGMMDRGFLLAVTGKNLHAVQMLTSGITASQSTGTTLFMPLFLSCLAIAYATLDQFDDARRSISQALTAVETTGERWWEADIHRAAGEIALMSPKPDAAKAEAYFERALAVAREQQAKSWELRSAMSMARLWRDQGKRDEARELLTPVYGWFTEGFATLDLKEAKALLEELGA